MTHTTPPGWDGSSPTQRLALSGLLPTQEQHSTATHRDPTILDILHTNANHRFALASEGSVLGVWDSGERVFRAWLGKTLDGTWLPMPALLVNGQPIVREWIALDGAIA